ncbi:MAG: hypothetical protein U1E87_05675 [Alphaproteobacteria bacterium]
MSALLHNGLMQPGALSWPLSLLLVALFGAGAAIAARERAGIAFAAGLFTFAAIAATIGEAWRADGTASAPLVGAAAVGLIGLVAWLCAPANDLGLRRRAWLPALVLALVAAGFGVAAAPDFPALIVWLTVAGAANYALLLAVSPERRAARVLVLGEIFALLGGAGALVFLGHAGPGLTPIGLAAPAAAAGAVLLLAHILMRAGFALFGLAHAAKARALTVELALGALAVPMLLAAAARILSGFAPVLPPEFFDALAAIGAAGAVAAAALFVAARERGARLAWLGASLAGIVLLIAGASGANRAGEAFAELVFAPFAALIAGASLASVFAERREAMPAGFGGALEFALALAGLGVIGLPPFAGFWPRLLVMDAAVRAGDMLLPAVLILASLLLVVGLARAGFAERAPAQQRARPVRVLEIAAFGLLLGISLAAGLTPRLSPAAPQEAGAAGLPPVAKATEPR